LLGAISCSSFLPDTSYLQDNAAFGESSPSAHRVVACILLVVLAENGPAEINRHEVQYGVGGATETGGRPFEARGRKTFDS
jgi:hypothetical protein